MKYNLTKLVPVLTKLELIAPNNIKHEQLLKAIGFISHELELILPTKRSGYSYQTMIYVELYALLTGLSSEEATNDLQFLWKGNEIEFQSFEVYNFSNGKERRAIPDQPSVSRFLKMISEQDLADKFCNILLWGQFMYLLHSGLIENDLTVLVDYNDELCVKDLDDNYCFGTQKGKSVYRSLSFSIISKDLHIVIGTYKIMKRCHKLPFFQEILNKLNSNGVIVKYFLMDRGFYRKEILQYLKNSKINVIIPGRKCIAIRDKMLQWLFNQGKRTGIINIPLGYVRGSGHQTMRANFILYGKKGYELSNVKKEFKNGLITEEHATQRIFPLLYIKANNIGVKRVKTSESYIRDLYRDRWNIEIAFRTTHVIGVGNWLPNRDRRHVRFGLKCFIYNQWQISKKLESTKNPDARPITLKEFCGRLTINRGKWFI